MSLNQLIYRCKIEYIFTWYLLLSFCCHVEPIELSVINQMLAILILFNPTDYITLIGKCDVFFNPIPCHLNMEAVELFVAEPTI